MSERFRLIAFLATLVNIQIMFIVSCILLYNGRSVEAIGVGSIMVGLIGIAGTLVGARAPADTVKIDQKNGDPVPVEEIRS
jgi:hypothetical protein